MGVVWGNGLDVLRKSESRRQNKRGNHPEQQLPGVPQELGVPQQPPELGSGIFRDELLDVL